MNPRAALKGQYHAALGMLRQAIDACPESLWGEGEVPFWRVVYHTLYFTHLYLQPDEARFAPWKHHRPDHQDLPWPPGSGPRIDNPYTKAEMLTCWDFSDAAVDAAVDGLDLDAPSSGFSWHSTIPKFEHQIHNTRHIQHHAALLSGRLRTAKAGEVRWLRSRDRCDQP
jgi:hypothetical protein